MAPVFNIAVFIYPGADILDFCGPLEIFTSTPSPGKESTFQTTTFAAEDTVKVGQNALTLVPDTTIKDIEANLENYDIIIVPGSWPDFITKMLKSPNGQTILNVLKRFANMKPREEAGHRIIQSVCSGAMILAAAGLLANRTITTHHMCFDPVKQLADEAAGGESHCNIVSKRWMDAGVTEAGVRIVNAGGVSSGIDASLYVVEMLAGKETAEWAADIAEFERRKQDDGWKGKFSLPV